MNDHSGFAHAARHAITYHCLTPDPAQSLVFGCGATGGTVHTPDDSLYLLLTRSDLWNERAAMGALAGLRLRGRPGLFTQSSPVSQVCRMSDATIELRLATPNGEVVIVLTCLRGRDTLVVDITDNRREPEGWTVCVENWHAGDTLASWGPGRLETLHVNRTSVYSDTNRRVGVDAAALGLRDPLLGRAWGLWLVAEEGAEERDGTLALTPSKRHRIVVATACTAPADNRDAEAETRTRGRALAETPPDTFDNWFAEHRAWWRGFWDKSFVVLRSGTGEAEYEERLWYANLYALACGMGGPYPMRFNGGPFLMDKDHRSWDYGYWGQNMRLVYFPMLAAGHLEFVREYVDWSLGNRRFVAAQTKALFGIDGLAWRETQSFWGADTASSLAEPNEVMHHHFTNNLELCLLMEACYLATGDQVFLRKSLFPALRGVLEFFRNYAKEGADGRLHLSPAAAVEVWPQMVDPQSEICGLRYFLPKAIAWAERLGEPAALIDKWRGFAAKLPEIPVGRWHLESSYCNDGIHDERWLLRSELRSDGIYLPAADQTRGRTRRGNMENAELYIVFPWGMVNLDSPAEDRRRIENTWNHRTWRLQNNGWAQDAVQVARLGWREELRQALREHASYTQRFPNGLFICAAGCRFHGMLTDTPYFDSSGAHLTALAEMFLQCHEGVLKLAPAVPECWSGACRLHAPGGFVVELNVARGLPTQATITATRAAETLRVRNHRWEAMRVAGDTAETASGALLERAMAANESVELRWAGVENEPLPPEPSTDVVWPEYKIRGPLAAVRSGHWHDERKNHGQVGLLADGLFPSTRRPSCTTSR